MHEHELARTDLPSQLPRLCRTVLLTSREVEALRDTCAGEVGGSSFDRFRDAGIKLLAIGKQAAFVPVLLRRPARLSPPMRRAADLPLRGQDA